ncbi:MAG TPA: DUF4097 family beta strand repeat-containing protein [Dehalococcoidia bacterium]|nr:DUF4097 family beta strand repeat-containing protein [Dehalococcoidia bacterium]
MARFDLNLSRHYDVGGPLKLDLRLTDGRIRIRGADSSEAKVDIRLEVHAASQEDADDHAAGLADGIRFAGDTLTIESQHGFGWLWGHRRVRAEYEITVPRQTRARAELASGSIHVQEIAGPLDFHLANGPLTVTGVDSVVQARLANGQIDARDCRGSIDITVANGQVHLERVGGPVEIEVANGPIHIEEASLAVSAHLLNGAITYRGGLGGDFNLNARHGSIDLQLPAGSRFELDAEAHHGQVHSDFQVAEGAGRRDGAHRVRLRTGHGNIHLSEARKPAPAAV